MSDAGHPRIRFEYRGRKVEAPEGEALDLARAFLERAAQEGDLEISTILCKRDPRGRKRLANPNGSPTAAHHWIAGAAHDVLKDGERLTPSEIRSRLRRDPEIREILAQVQTRSGKHILDCPERAFPILLDRGSMAWPLLLHRFDDPGGPFYGRLPGNVGTRPATE